MTCHEDNAHRVWERLEGIVQDWEEGRALSPSAQDFWDNGCDVLGCFDQIGDEAQGEYLNDWLDDGTELAAVADYIAGELEARLDTRAVTHAATDEDGFPAGAVVDPQVRKAKREAL